jgi:hypothetical protein
MVQKVIAEIASTKGSEPLPAAVALAIEAVTLFYKAV